MLKKCIVCGKDYKAYPYNADKRKYCSHKCFSSVHDAWHGKKRPEQSEWLRRAYKTGRKKKISMPNEKNPAWKGDEAGYHAMHKWLEANWGRPSECELCGSTEKRKYEWANKDHSYKRKRDDYIRLCTSCHRKWDILNNNYLRK